MRKKLLRSLLVGGLCLALCSPLTAYADGQKVVTLGADLTQDQKNAILKYFGVLGQSIETLTITNQDERNHLGSYVPLEQIGTRTYSCALVCPTSSGGIQVKTANLSWVTSNMIATTLSTSGVVNCDVLAASPFEVSGTGALTGIIMAYETASGTTLDPVKKELATQELITTGTIANQIGQKQATNIVNEIKIQVIQGAVVEPEQVEEIVEEVVDENPEVELSDEDRALLTGLMTQIAEQQYDYDEMKDTLERVEENVSDINDKVDEIQSDLASTEAGTEITTETETEVSTDSILMNTDDSALGEGVTIDATNEDALPEQTQTEATEATEDIGFDITTSDTYTDGNTEITEAPITPETTETAAPEGTGEDITVDIMGGEETAATEYTEAPVETVDPAAGAEGEYTDDTTLPAQTEFPAETDAVPEIAVLELTPCVVVPGRMEEGEQAYAGSQIVKLIYGNENLVPVSGTLTITDAYGSVTTIDLANTEQVKALPASQEDLMMNGWTAGTQILINTNCQLAANETYTMSVEGVVAQTADASILDGVPTAAVSSVWNVTTAADGVTFSADRLASFTAGSVVSGTVNMEETATYAVISSYDDTRLSFDIFEFSPEAPGFNMTCLQSGDAFISIDYYDAEGNYLTSADVDVTIF